MEPCVRQSERKTRTEHKIWRNEDATMDMDVSPGKKKKKKNVYFDRMFLVRRPTIKAYNEAASMQVT